VAAKPEFGAFLKARLRELKLNQKEFAFNLHVPRQTFLSWFDKKIGFPKWRMEEILRLAKVNMTLEEVQERFSIKFQQKEKPSESESNNKATDTDLMGTIEALDKKWQQIEKNFEPLGKQTKELTSVMGAYDYAASLSSTLIFFAFRGKDDNYRAFAESIARAIQNKAIFVFFTPTHDVVTNYYKEEWGINGTESAKSFADGFKALREACIQHVAQEKAGGCLPETCQPDWWVGSRLGHFPVDDCPMWVPGFAFTLLGTTKRDKQPKWRALVRVPDNRFGGLFPFPQEEFFRNRLLEFCKRESVRLCERTGQELRQGNRKGQAGGRRISAEKLRAKQAELLLLMRFQALVHREECNLHLVEDDNPPAF